jgi:hypothetical protein
VHRHQIRYGRGRRETAWRSARAPTDSPISASSAAACTAVPRISAPSADENDRARAGSEARAGAGVTSGWAGWRRRAGSGAARLSLRRCGRRRGSRLRSSDSVSSLIALHIIAYAIRR